MNEDKSKLQLIVEIAQANNKNLELIEELNDREDEINELQERIDKAIEYIENNVLSYIDEDGLESITDKEENELLNILRGEDKR